MRDPTMHSVCVSGASRTSTAKEMFTVFVQKLSTQLVCNQFLVNTASTAALELTQLARNSTATDTEKNAPQ